MPRSGLPELLAGASTPSRAHPPFVERPHHDAFAGENLLNIFTDLSLACSVVLLVQLLSWASILDFPGGASTVALGLCGRPVVWRKET
jgi:hypothetical protein